MRRSSRRTMRRSSRRTKRRSSRRALRRSSKSTHLAQPVHLELPLVLQLPDRNGQTLVVNPLNLSGPAVHQQVLGEGVSSGSRGKESWLPPAFLELPIDKCAELMKKNTSYLSNVKNINLFSCKFLLVKS